MGQIKISKTHFSALEFFGSPGFYNTETISSGLVQQ